VNGSDGLRFRVVFRHGELSATKTDPGKCGWNYGKILTDKLSDTTAV
jgi:hypothetical protein